MLFYFYMIKILIIFYLVIDKISYYCTLFREKDLLKLWGDEILADMPSRLEGEDNGIKTV